MLFYEKGGVFVRVLSYHELIRLKFTCDCQPHEDINTFYEWKKNGYWIKKGAKAKRVQVRVLFPYLEHGIKKENIKTYYIYLFCKCQVYQKNK